MHLTRTWQPSVQLLRSVRKTTLIPTLCGRHLKRNSHFHHGVGQWVTPPQIHFLQCLAYSTKTIVPGKHSRQIVEVREFLSSRGERQEIERLRSTSKTSWKIVEEETKNPESKDAVIDFSALPKKAASLLLPEAYPHSVADGYLPFVSYCFVASIAGSAAMVLSTQTLLLAVGIVGQHSTSAGIMAGALNWVLKDFMGQLGGIVFASKMGKQKAFDNDPKRWRMVAATALDGATFLEILSPLCHASMVLPIASVANIGKNIGFLTASASRASLHQSLALKGNLGDVTVKAGSQSMAASLVGTSLGIGLSSLLSHDVLNFGLCFVGLSAIHQGCTYSSLQNVPLAHFNRHRLHLAMEYYIQNDKIPSPVDTAKMETFVPLFSSDASKEWLGIGRPLREVCISPSELEDCLSLAPNEAYLVQFNENSQQVDLIYFDTANEEDVCRGMYHACLIRHETMRQKIAENVTRETHRQVQQNFSNLFEELQTQGWNISSGVTDVEDENAHRIQINKI